MEKILKQAEDYRFYAQCKCNAHYLMAVKNKTKHTWLGVFAVFSSTIVGTTIFATISKTPIYSMQIIAGFLSVSAAVLSAFVTFFRFSEISQQHKNAASDFETVRHKLDIFLLSYVDKFEGNIEQTVINDLQSISMQLDKIAKSEPPIPDKIWNKTKNDLVLQPIINERSA